MNPPTILNLSIIKSIKFLATEVYVKGFTEAQYRTSIKKEKERNEQIIVDAYAGNDETISQFKNDEVLIKSVLMTDEDTDCYIRYKRIQGKQKLTKIEDINLREERNQIYEKIKYMFKKLTKLVVPTDDAEIKVPIQHLLLQEQSLHKTTKIKLKKANKVIAIQNRENKVLGKEIVKLKKKIVRQDGIIQNYQSEESDTEDEESNTEDEKSDVEVEKSDVEVEKSDTEGEKGNVEVEKSDVEVEKSDAEGEKGNAEVENSGMEDGKSDVEVEKSDVEVEKGDVEVEKDNQRGLKRKSCQIDNSVGQSSPDIQETVEGKKF